MLAGAGETITVLLNVTPGADTVCSLLLHPAEVRITGIVEYRLKFPVCPLTLSTPVFVITSVTTQVTHHHRLSFWTLLQSYGLELLVMNVDEL